MSNEADLIKIFMVVKENNTLQPPKTRFMMYVFDIPVLLLLNKEWELSNYINYL